MVRKGQHRSQSLTLTDCVKPHKKEDIVCTTNYPLKKTLLCAQIDSKGKRKSSHRFSAYEEPGQTWK